MNIQETKNSTDFISLQILFNKYLGEGYVTDEDVNGWASNDWLVMVIKVDGKVIAGRTSCIVNNADLTDHMLQKSKDVQIPHGLLKTMVTEISYRGKGLAQSLTTYSIDWFREKGIKKIYTVSWENGTEQKSSKYLFKLGFNSLCELEKPWKTNCDLDSSYCIYRKNNTTCCCNATVMSIQIK